MKRRTAIIFTVYFPVMLVAGQVAVNLLSFLWPQAYYATGFYLNTFFGVNVFFAAFLVVFTFTFSFCRVSRYVALAEMAFAVNYLIVKEDNLYNILFQVIVGLTALAITFRQYTEKFPLCRLSLYVDFLRSVLIKRGSCRKAIDHWVENTKNTVIKQRANGHS